MPATYLRLRMLSAAILALAALTSAASAQSTDTKTAPAATGAKAAALPSKQYKIEDFIETVGVSGASFSADESRILFSSNKSGIWNTYSMPVGGGEWTALTRSATDNNYAVSYFPDDDRVLVT